jgi:hypothetical protein
MPKSYTNKTNHSLEMSCKGSDGRLGERNLEAPYHLREPLSSSLLMSSLLN